MLAAVLVMGGVLQNERVVFRLAERLYALAGSGRRCVDMLADGSGADEGNALYIRMLEQEFRFVSAARHDIQNAVREPCLFIEFCKPQARHRRCGRCLQNIGVAAGNGQRGHPAHRDHGREVPGGDAGVYAERLAVAHGVIAIGDVHLALAHHQRRDAAREFGHFQSLLHIARSFRTTPCRFPVRPSWSTRRSAPRSDHGV